MLNFKMMKEILEELEDKGLFNDFIVNILEYNKNDFNKLIIRYKTENDLIIDIFDYRKENKFTRYYFTKNKEISEINDNDIIINVIDLKEYYDNFNLNNKFSLFSSLFYEEDINKLNKYLDKLFDLEIKNIIMKHLKN